MARRLRSLAWPSSSLFTAGGGWRERRSRVPPSQGGGGDRFTVRVRLLVSERSFPARATPKGENKESGLPELQLILLPKTKTRRTCQQQCRSLAEDGADERGNIRRRALPRPEASCRGRACYGEEGGGACFFPYDLFAVNAAAAAAAATAPPWQMQFLPPIKFRYWGCSPTLYVLTKLCTCFLPCLRASGFFSVQYF